MDDFFVSKYRLESAVIRTKFGDEAEFPPLKGLIKIADRNLSFIIANNMDKILNEGFFGYHIQKEDFFNRINKKYGFDYTPSTFYDCIKGKRDIPFVIVFAFCEHFGVSIDDLLAFKKISLKPDSPNHVISADRKAIKERVDLSKIYAKKAKEKARQVRLLAEDACEKADRAYNEAKEHLKITEDDPDYIFDNGSLTGIISGGDKKEGKLSGFGMEITSEGKYCGQWENGKRKGYGIFTSTDGGVYIAKEWGNEEITYYGVYERRSHKACAFCSHSNNPSKPRSCCYSGELVGDNEDNIEINGHGCCTCLGVGNVTYEGTFKDGLWNGYGSMIVFGEDIRSGEWTYTDGLKEDVSDI